MTLGSTYAINSTGMTKDNLVTAIRSLPPFTESITSPFGPTAIVDTTGVSELLEAALASVNRLGRVVQLSNQGPGSSVRVGLPEHMRDGVHLTGTIQGDADPNNSIPMMIRWYREGKLPLEKIERFFDVADFQKARDEMHSGSTIKPVLCW